MGAVALKVLQSLRQLHCGRQIKQQIHVVCGAAHSHQRNLLGLGNARKISPKKPRLADQIPSLFRAEDAVHKERGIRVRHGSRVEVAGRLVR